MIQLWNSILVQLAQIRLHWYGHVARCSEGELIREIILSTTPCSWRRRTGGQLKTRTLMLKEDMEPLFGLLVFG